MWFNSCCLSLVFLLLKRTFKCTSNEAVWALLFCPLPGCLIQPVVLTGNANYNQWYSAGCWLVGCFLHFSCRLTSQFICAKTTCFILLSLQANANNCSVSTLVEIRGYRLTFDHQDNKQGQPTGLIDAGTVDNNDFLVFYPWILMVLHFGVRFESSCYDVIKLGTSCPGYYKFGCLVEFFVTVHQHRRFRVAVPPVGWQGFKLQR